MAQDVKDSGLRPEFHEIKVEVDIKPEIIKYEDPVAGSSGQQPVSIKTEPDVSWIKIEVDPLPDDEEPSSSGEDPLNSVKTEPQEPMEQRTEASSEEEGYTLSHTRKGKQPSHLADTANKINFGNIVPRIKLPLLNKNAPKNTKTKTENKNSSTDKKPFACATCGFRFKKRFYLSRHLLTHSGEKPFSCDVCEYRTTHKSALTTHYRIHTGEKPFSCDICDFRCTAKGTLIVHLRKHSDARPYACNLCNYKCKQKNHLVIHSKVHTTEKPFFCELCCYRSSRQSDVNRHLKIHGDIKPFVCDFCEYKSNRSCNLKKHLLIHNRTKEKSELGQAIVQ